MNIVPEETVRDAILSHKICVLIPTYNNAGTLERVLSEVLRYSPSVVVVNDGSSDGTTEILSGFKDRIHLVTHTRNKGKGAALKSGFEYAAAAGFEYAVTIDSDGQHYASDIPAMVKATIENPQSIIVGERNLSGVDINGKSSFANKFSNFWFALQTGKRLKDTQTGFRVYPLKRLYGLSVLTSRYEAELELLVLAAWNGVRIVPVPIRVYYPPQSERVSHFRPALDFTRISILNTVLCLAAIFYGIPARMWSGIRNRRFFSREIPWFTKNGGKRRDAAFTLGRIFRSAYGFVFFLFWCCCVFTPYALWIGKFRKNSEKARLRLHRMLRWISATIVKVLPATNIKIEDVGAADFAEPKLIVCNHQSYIDLPIIMSLSPRIVFLTNDWVWHNRFFGKIVRAAEFLPVSAGVEELLPKLKDLISRGYSIVVFPEGTRSDDDAILRFHQGAFYLAQELNLAIKPLALHGAGNYLRKHDGLFRRGDIQLAGQPPVGRTELCNLPLRKQASLLRRTVQERYDSLARRNENIPYFAGLVKYKYAYRGWDVVSACKKVLSYPTLHEYIENQPQEQVRIINSGYGIFALVYAYVNKSAQVYAFEEDIAKHNVAAATSNIPGNLHFVHSVWNECDDGSRYDKTISLQGGMSVCAADHVVEIPLKS